MRRLSWILVCAALAGCPKGKDEVPDAGPADAGPDVLSEKEPNERPDQALTLARDAVVSAALLGGFRPRATRTGTGWRPPLPRTAEITVSGIPGGDVTLEVYDRDRNRLGGVNSEGEGKPERYPNLYVERERYVRVAPARKGSGGAYTLTLTYRRPNDGEEREPNDRAVDSTPLALGQTVAAYIGHAGDEDWYRIELPAQQAATPPAPTEGRDASGSGPHARSDRGRHAPGSRGHLPSAPPAEGSTPPAAAPTEGSTPPPAEGSATPPPQAPAPRAPPERLRRPLPPWGSPKPPPPVEPPGVALKIELSSIEGVRPELAVLSAAEAPLFSLRASKEGEPLTLRNIGVRATDQRRLRGGEERLGGLGQGGQADLQRHDARTPSPCRSRRPAPTPSWSPMTSSTRRRRSRARASRRASSRRRTTWTTTCCAPRSPCWRRWRSPAWSGWIWCCRRWMRRRATGKQETVTLKANDGELKEPERLNNVSCSGTCYFKVEGASRKVEGKWVRDYENPDQPYRITFTAVPDNGSEEREPNNTVDRAMEISTGKAVRGTVYPPKDVDYYRLDLTDRPVRTPVHATLLGILKVDVGLYLHRWARTAS